MAELPASERYTSRKFVITAGGMLLAFVAAMAGKMTGDLSLVLITAIGGYNAANAFLTGKGAV